MSDFDEEAERERLREQFEQDRKKREATEQMSELLLQGATMTDTHCETCGDPIFRYDGQEFCPTCQQAAGENAADGTNAGDGADDTATADDGTPETQSAAASQPAEPAANTTDTPDEQAVESPEIGATDRTEQPGASGQTASPPSSAQPGQRVDVPGLEPGEQRPPSHGAGDLQDARDSLVATLSSFARQAEATDDPRRAQDALEAAHEAAEALAALDAAR